MNEKSTELDYIDYFTSLEQQRSYENLQCHKTRRFKQQQLWFALDNEQANVSNENSFQSNSQIATDDLPLMNEIKISDSEIINQDSIEIIKIINGNSSFLPNGLYERLLICLHPLL
jgi:hypothetical protein